MNIMSLSPFDPNYTAPQSKVNNHKHKTLKDAPKTRTQTSLWGISTGNVSLKIGRYNKNEYGYTESDFALDENNIKQGLTLDKIELKSLIEFIESDYQPMNLGLKNYVPIEGSLSLDKISALQKLFSSDKKEELAELLSLHKIIPDDIADLLELKRRQRAITVFETNMELDVLESIWQVYFNQNKWIFHTELVNILDDRRPDVSNTVDYIVQAPDGFVDVIELKRYRTYLISFLKTVSLKYYGLYNGFNRG